MNWVKNRWFDALLKFVAIYLVFNLVFSLIGMGTSGTGLLGMNMFWTNLADFSWLNYLISLIVSAVLYFLVFFTLSRDIRKDY